MVNEIRIAGFADDSIVDGPGLRFVIFTQGCLHHCPGCHNPETHALEGGSVTSVDEILDRIRKNPLLDGITLSGGEPFLQPEACSLIAQGAKNMGLSVMTYTGYTFEEIMAVTPHNGDWRALSDATDLLVDGRFELRNRDLSLRFRGSSNQRIIDLAASKRAGTVVLAEL